MKFMPKLIHLALVFIFLISSPAYAAVVHFYSYPEVTSAIFHVNIEYRGYYYDADTRLGGVRINKNNYSKVSDLQVHVPDELINEAALDSQLGLPFDFKFEWYKARTYCSKMVGIALDMEPQPMTFAGTHYLKYYPEWIHRNDPGLSPEQVLEFSLKHATSVTGQLR